MNDIQQEGTKSMDSEKDATVDSPPAVAPTERAIMATAEEDDQEPQTVVITMTLNVLNERLMRRIAADRMTRSGYGGRVEDHVGLPLDRLVYEAIFASNPDPLSPVEMGFEIVSTSTE